MKSMAAVESAKRAAVVACIDANVKSGYVVGVGTGSTAKFVAPVLAERIKLGTLNNIICIPTSFQARHLINSNGLLLSDLERNPIVDVDIDGADEVDDKLDCIKGGGGCLGLEKLVQSCAKKFFIVGDTSKRSARLGTNYKKLPLEVLPAGYVPVKQRIERELGGTCELRMAVMKAGPVVTDSGNYLLDWHFPDFPTRDWAQVHMQIKLMTGIVETGLFLSVGTKAYLGDVENPEKVVVVESGLISNGH